MIGTTGQGTQAGLHMDERTEGITTETGEATCNPMAGMLPAPGDATGSPASDQCRLAEQENSLTTGEFTSYRPIPVQDYCFDKPTILIVGEYMRILMYLIGVLCCTEEYLTCMSVASIIVGGISAAQGSKECEVCQYVSTFINMHQCLLTFTYNIGCQHDFQSAQVTNIRTIPQVA